MPELGEGVHTPAPPTTDAAPPANGSNERRRVKVRLSLSFDGTGNNRVNTDHRLQSTEVYRKHRKGSYANDYSNVARLELCLDKKAKLPGFDYYISVYTEGIGTLDSEKDDRLPGQVLGMGETGVVGKVDKGLLEAAARISRTVPQDNIIEQLTVDTFGFSRGAAAARYCVFRLRNEDRRWKRQKRCLREILESMGYVVEKLVVRAVGLYDTVSAFGKPKEESDVEELKLDAIRDAQAVLHLAAAEEYRQNFSLTNIDSAGSKGRQIFLPGAHSDVGGGYTEGENETKTLVDGSVSYSIAQFMRKYGWYRDKEIFHNTGDLGYGYKTLEYVAVRRYAISQEYSFIPLRVMADFAREQELPVLDTLYEKYDPVNVPEAVRARIEAYAKSVGTSAAKDWQGDDAALCALRHDFLHLSAAQSIGMNMRLIPTGPRGDARPHRLVFDG